MAGSTGTVPRNQARLLKAAYLADTESMLRETRATGLYYFPGPIFWLLIATVFLYASAASVYTSLAPFPGLTNFFANGLGPHLGNSGLHDLFLLFVVLWLIAIIWLLVRYLLWMSRIYAVTNTRVIVQSGILGRDFDEIPIAQVRGVDVHQTVGQRILGYGTVRVSSEGGTRLGNEDWRGIPRPFEFQRLIESASAH